MKFTAAMILVIGVTATVTGMNTDKISGCKTLHLGKPDDEDWSDPNNFQGTIEVTLQTGNQDWRKFALGFDSEERIPIGYLQMEKKGHGIDITLLNWESDPQNEKQNITGNTGELFVKWTTITLRHSNSFLHVSVDKVFERTFTQVNAEPFKFVYAHVPANQYINVTLNCKQHGETNIHNPTYRPETVTSIDLSSPKSSVTSELESGTTVTVIIIVIILLVAAASGGYCFWAKKGCFHTMEDTNKQEDDTQGVNHTLLSQDPSARPTEFDSNSIKHESLEGLPELCGKGPGPKNEYEAKITEDSTKLELEEARNTENISEHLNENQDSNIMNKTPQTENDSLLLESQIIPRELSITKMDMNCQYNLLGPIPEETPLSVEHIQNYTREYSQDDLSDAMATLSIENKDKKDNQGIGKDLGKNTEDFPFGKDDTLNECTSTKKQTNRGSPQNNHPEITNRDSQKIEVHEEPVTQCVVIKLGETEGAIPTRLEEIRNSTTILETEHDS